MSLLCPVGRKQAPAFSSFDYYRNYSLLKVQESQVVPSAFLYLILCLPFMAQVIEYPIDVTVPSDLIVSINQPLPVSDISPTYYFNVGRRFFVLST